LEGKHHISDIIFVGTFQLQNVKNGRISIDIESDDKVVYLQKWEHVIMLKKRKRGSKTSKKGSEYMYVWQMP